MTNAEMLSRIFQALKQIDVSGCDFGRIELIVRDGQVKHVNVSYEVIGQKCSNSVIEKCDKITL